jgi:hypothetical protein
VADANLLQQIFEADKEQVETFSDFVEKNVNKITEEESFRLKKTAKLVTEQQKLIGITHGTHESSYVWHIRPIHRKRPWAVPVKNVVYAIGKVFHEYIPHEVLIDIFLPNSEWEIEEITVKALEVMDHWSITEDTLPKVTGQLFEVLNTLV